MASTFDNRRNLRRPAERSASTRRPLLTPEPRDQHESGFSLVTGGPLYRFLVRIKLLRPPVDFFGRRAAAFIALTWLPLLVATIASGTFRRGTPLPFAVDLEVHVKFLLAIPLLMAGQLLIHARVDGAVNQFVARGIVTPNDEPRFQALIARCMRVEGSAIIEGTLFLLASVGGHYLWRQQLMLHVNSWYATQHDGGIALTSAGYWYACVSLPIARFLLLRWYFRVLVWYYFLWQVARLRLRVDALHPDRAGGLGFLEHTATDVGPALFAQSAIMSGAIASRILSTGAKLPDFELEIGSLVALLLIVGFLPLTFFVAHTVRATWRAHHAYGEFATFYTRAFWEKWLEGRRPSAPELLGSDDVRTLADIGQSYAMVSGMRRLPFSLTLVPRLAILLAVPFLPLALTMIPLKEVIMRLAKLVV